VQEEEFTGALKWLVAPSMPEGKKILKAYAEFNADLKRRVEGA
jgi:hypothetical protein